MVLSAGSCASNISEFCYIFIIIIYRAEYPLHMQSLMGVNAVLPEFTSRVVSALNSLSNC